MTGSRLRPKGAETLNTHCQLHIAGDGCRVFKGLEDDMVPVKAAGASSWNADYTGALLRVTDPSLANVTDANVKGVELENNSAIAAAGSTYLQVGN